MTISGRTPEDDSTPHDEWSDVEQVLSQWESRLKEIEAERTPATESTVALALHPMRDPSEVRSAEDLFWHLPE